VLVVGEVALATMLLVAAGLLAQSYTGLNQVNPGFDPDGVMTMAMTLPESRYHEIETRDRFYEQVLARTMALPGVASAGFVNTLPFSTYDDGTTHHVRWRAANPAATPSCHFASSAIATSRRCAFPRSAAACSIAATRATALPWRSSIKCSRIGTSPIDRPSANASYDDNAWGRLQLERRGEPDPWLTIVGIVGDVRHSNLSDTVQPELYLPMSQAAPAMMMLAARTSARPEDLTAPIRDAIRAIDPAQPVITSRRSTRWWPNRWSCSASPPRR
jgi:putative ABC transport system permease protein